MKNRYHILLLALLVLSACSSKNGNSNNVNEESGKPNIILIMADDLGYGDISCYGSPMIHTPNLDKMAIEGVKFTDFHSNGPVCSPTRAALMTGKYQQRTGVEGVVTAASHRDVGLNLNEITIAEELKNSDYVCGIFGKWHLGYAPQFNPRLQGFDRFVGFVSGNVDYHAHIDQEGYLDWWNDTIINNEEGYTTDLITQYGVEFIKQNSDNPFFLYLAQEAPHSPYQGRGDKAFRRVGVKKVHNEVPVDGIPGIYKEMVEIMDEGIGEIIQALKDNKIEDRTIVIFCSDNGANKYGNVGSLRGSKGSVYEGGHRVPAIAWYPGNFKAGTICETPVMSMDFFPTILDFAGIETANNNIDGISLKNLLIKGEGLTERDLFWSFNNKHAIRSGKWKLVSTVVKGEENIELFDLSLDLSEERDLSEQHPELAKKLKQKLDDWQIEVRQGIERVSP